jgi:hypothetical protein
MVLELIMKTKNVVKEQSTVHIPKLVNNNGTIIIYPVKYTIVINNQHMAAIIKNGNGT